MISVIAVIFVFSVIVLIHELGHYLAARAMGVRVDKFSIGFPPTVFSKKYGQTEFSIGAIPLGGYVKMAGFIDESLDANETGAEDEFNSKSTWRKVIIITAGVVMNLILAIAVLGFLNYSNGERIIPETTVGLVGAQGIAQKVGFKIHDKILAVNGKAVHNWNEIQQAFVDNLNKEIIFTVERNGQRINLDYHKSWFKEKKGEVLDIQPLFSARVGDVSYSMPAGKLGLKKGDLITSIAGKPVKDWQEMTESIRSHPGQEIEIQWKRGYQLLSGKIIPQKFEETDKDGKKIEVGKIGISYYYESKDVGVARALVNGVNQTYDLMALNLKSLGWVLTGTKSASEIIGGPIMIAKMAGDAAHAGWDYLLYLIAALSAVLALFNIFPIPGLDGGHLFFILLEGIMRKPLPIQVRVKIQQIGMAILLTLMIFIFYIDLRRFL